MCGIIGYIGQKDAREELLSGLYALEYRGYDSSGIALVAQGGLVTVRKKKGRISELEALLKSDTSVKRSGIGIGHTRWATHGAPNDANSHPHRGNVGLVTVVHNGIIENYVELRAECIARGEEFSSETDTEVLAHLIEFEFEKDRKDPLGALQRAIAKAQGSWGLCVLFEGYPQTIFAAKKDSPLLIGFGKGENYVASDITAFLSSTREYLPLCDGDCAVVSAENVEIYDAKGTLQNREHTIALWDKDSAQKGAYDCFMNKEIHEQPETVNKLLKGRTKDSLPDFSADGFDVSRLAKAETIHIVACGSAMHSALYGKHIIEELARIPVKVEVASEFRYENPIMKENDFAFVISQSGETADTLAALRLIKQRGIPNAAIVNVAASTIAREADGVLLIKAGPEIAVATTKAYTSQSLILALLAVAVAYKKGTISDKYARELTHNITTFSDSISEMLESTKKLENIATRLENQHSAFFIGRGRDYATIFEASLKLKEITYIHSEAYAAGELKHGTISLVTDDVNVIAFATDKDLFDKTLSNIKEVKARRGYVFLITGKDGEYLSHSCDETFVLPEVDDHLAPLLAVICCQYIAYLTSKGMGLDVDKPRNLAKSVTVE